MKQVRKIILVVAVGIVVSVTSCNGQLFLRGKVVDAQNKSGVPYANISVTNAAYGTSTDNDGDFLIRVEEGGLKGWLKLSCIGYHNLILSLDSLSKVSTDDIVVAMTPQ